MGFKQYRFDVLRLWLEPANDSKVARPWPVAPSKRKDCRKAVKAELKSLRKSSEARDAIKRAWIAARCVNCGRCPKMAKGA